MRPEDVKVGLVYAAEDVWLVLSVEGSNRGQAATYVHFTEVPLTGQRAGRARSTTFTFANGHEMATPLCTVLEEGR